MTDEEKAYKYTDEHGFGSDCNNLTSYDANQEIEQAYLAGLKAGEVKAKREIEEELLKCYQGYPEDEKQV